jgi:hypothetical protein
VVEINGPTRRIERSIMKRRQIGVAVLAAGVLAGFFGCGDRPEGWTPVLEETSTAFLETETDRLLEHVRTALESLTQDPGQAESALTQAESELEHLKDYYLPLFKARELAYNAYRSFYLGDEARVTEQLQGVEDILGAMAERAEGGRLQEIQSLAEKLADAELAVTSGGEEGAPALEVLARNLNQAALKGDLILRR